VEITGGVEDKMADVFVSYSREDRARADQIAQALQRHQVEVFWDSEIPPGQTWADYIEEKLSSCKVVLVLWSQHSSKSQWVREEARIGRDKGKLIPLMIDATPAPFGFGEVQAADLSNWSGDDADPSWQRVVSAVRAAAARAGDAPAPQPRAAMSPPMSPPAQSGFRPARDAAPAASAPAAPAKKGVNPIWWILGGGVAVLALLAIIGANMDDDTPPAPTPTPIDQPVNTPTPQPTQVSAEEYQRQVMAQLANVQQALNGQGFQMVGQPTTGALRTSAEQDIPVDLYVGYEYRIAAVCDNDCTDIDLTLFDGMGQVISQDNAVDAHPIVPVYVTGSGRFSVKVAMYTCTNQPCYYAAALFGRQAQ
jgi:hypothetical protein